LGFDSGECTAGTHVLVAVGSDRERKDSSSVGDPDSPTDAPHMGDKRTGCSDDHGVDRVTDNRCNEKNWLSWDDYLIGMVLQKAHIPGREAWEFTKTATPRKNAPDVGETGSEVDGCRRLRYHDKRQTVVPRPVDGGSMLRCVYGMNSWRRVLHG
jgi:hypothetical protein